MKEYRYSLEKYRGRNSKYNCPQCGKRTFVRYKDNYTGDYVNDNVGRCDRVDKCGYHLTPRMYFESTGQRPEEYTQPLMPITKPINRPVGTISFEIVRSTLHRYENNNFFKGLCRYFSRNEVLKVMHKYYVGTTRRGEAVFWQVTRSNQVRTGKIIQYDPDTLKRKSYVNWAHSKLQKKNYNLKQVYFGSHLLVDKDTPVAIAEGEKNAILGALHYPQYNWIATGGETLLNVDKLNALHNYNVTLFPDKGKAFERWKGFAEQAVFNVKINDTIEKTDLPEGADIADLVLMIKKQQKERSKPFLLSQMISKNPVLSQMIEMFNLQIDYSYE